MRLEMKNIKGEKCNVADTFIPSKCIYYVFNADSFQGIFIKMQQRGEAMTVMNTKLSLKSYALDIYGRTSVNPLRHV